MWFRVAKDVLHCTVAEAQRRLSYYEFRQWATLYSLSPFGDARADFHSAIVAFVTASAFAGKGYHPKLADFMPPELSDRSSRWQSAAEMQSRLKAFVTAHNRSCKRSKHGKSSR